MYVRRAGQVLARLHRRIAHRLFGSHRDPPRLGTANERSGRDSTGSNQTSSAAPRAPCFAETAGLLCAGLRAHKFEGLEKGHHLHLPIQLPYQLPTTNLVQVSIISCSASLSSSVTWFF